MMIFLAANFVPSLFLETLLHKTREFLLPLSQRFLGQRENVLKCSGANPIK